ncbi:MAG: Bifunctional transcriptional activator/DNA repair enzyme AdaA [Firmicutes bacterium ADurb.Bin248]|nr:MAG: Bifunctional transcriptional activator/DNA repair enzyme AdaA [Firmicutes bacterium ADurb.Bin248]HOG00545.1 PocR ligand-binding domain-containing protein [Clostridia bacterium]HPK16740.1 PocR ligand-binding domain-containing protein [Clostridia bacterium]
MKDLVDIRNIFQNDRFQQIQDALASSINLAIITVDYKGIPITKHSSRTEFCSIMRKGEQFKGLCERCDSRGGLEAARTQSHYIYLCHAGLVDLAIPIVVNNNYLGAVMAGQVLLSNKEDNLKLEQILHNFENSVSFEDVNTLRAYRSLSHMSLEKIKSIADMLLSIITIMVDETRLRIAVNALQKHQKYVHVDKEFYEAYARIFSGQYFDLTAEKQNISLLKPAFDYIQDNLEGDLSIKKVASICNVSPSYFSKLFAKENLGSYTDYINKTKIERAKQFLTSTHLSINDISVKLGFNDCGYFIKVFNRFEGMTPAAYRVSMMKTR